MRRSAYSVLSLPLLQWGHGLGAVEAIPARRRAVIRGRASMGPRLGSRGGVPGFRGNQRAGEASMGPRLGSRGGARQSCGDRRRATRPRRAILGISVQEKLQWGHGLGAVEAVLLDVSVARGNRFNGATAWEPWRLREVGRYVAILYASMGPRLGSRGGVCDRDKGAQEVLASMGPRLGSRGGHRTGGRRGAVSEASMGPRLGSRGGAAGRSGERR